MIVDGSSTCVNELQPSKVKSSISETEEGMETSVSEEHFLNAELQIFVTEEGISI